MLTLFRYTLAPSYIEHMMSIKNETEVDGLRTAYLRDGVSFVRISMYPILMVFSTIPTPLGKIFSMAGN